MPFESLSEYYEFKIDDFPSDWLPLTYLYDPDLPLFPIQYFHILDPNLPSGQRPTERDRLFGFIHHVNLEKSNLSVTVATNKNLAHPNEVHFQPALENIIKCRLGLENPVTHTDMISPLLNSLAGANKFIMELWYQVVSASFGKALPFGRMCDPIFGLARYVASWNSQGGRKGELIQTHGFVSSFGVNIQTGNDIHADFFLLPTYEELIDISNPLNFYPKFSMLTEASNIFVSRYCETLDIEPYKFSAFKLSEANAGNKLKTSVILKIISESPNNHQKVLFDNYSVFNRGPQRSIIFLMMLNDLRHKRWDPESLNPEFCGRLYSDLKGSYQTPKVIQLYAQQCFGSEAALPIDIWIETFLKWPINFNSEIKKDFYSNLFKNSDSFGKLERLIWISAQARKVHSSVCKDILWCIRYGAPKEKSKIFMRGANPLSCKICSQHIRDVCPSFNDIKDDIINFNNSSYQFNDANFNIVTSKRNNIDSGQTIVSCEGSGIRDEYSTRDRSDSFNIFPAVGHDGSALTVSEFIYRY